MNVSYSIFTIAILFYLVSAFADSASGSKTIEIRLNASHYRVELATTPVQRRRGLMFRKKLEADAGMLFVYPVAGDHRIWMKNTLIPLQVVWIDEEFRVISIQRLEPCIDQKCKVYGAQKPTRYILELSDHELDIKPGDVLEGIAEAIAGI